MFLNSNNYLDYDLKNKIVIFPTDTVYGIGCLYKDIDSIRKIYDIKDRDFSKPMVILCSNFDQIRTLIERDQEITRANNNRQHFYSS